MLAVYERGKNRRKILVIIVKKKKKNYPTKLKINGAFEKRRHARQYEPRHARSTRARNGYFHLFIERRRAAFSSE